MQPNTVRFHPLLRWSVLSISAQRLAGRCVKLVETATAFATSTRKQTDKLLREEVFLLGYWKSCRDQFEVNCILWSDMNLALERLANLQTITNRGISDVVEDNKAVRMHPTAFLANIQNHRLLAQINHPHERGLGEQQAIQQVTAGVTQPPPHVAQDTSLLSLTLHAPNEHVSTSMFSGYHDVMFIHGFPAS